MIRLLVDAPDGLQRLIEVREGGGYFDLARVLWDERLDGKFPPEHLPNVGGLVRSNGSLSVNAAKLSAYQAAIAAAVTAESTRQARIDAALNLLKTQPLGGALTATEVSNLVKALVIVWRNS